MGTLGNKPGYKIFSINTTVRNPKRNTEFLNVLKNFDREILTDELKNKIYYEVIRQGIYKLSNLSQTIIKKYENGKELSDKEIEKAIKDNPQKTGDAGRLMTQIRAIKDCGFLTLEGKRNKLQMRITELGQMLLGGYDAENIYSKAMIGLHANNPQRTTYFNESRPFLNTIFVIDGINKYYNKKENNKEKFKKGILEHEFAYFVLSMKDCDYNEAIDNIIKYRNKFGKRINIKYLENYVFNILNENVVSYSTVNDYADDVFRKFDMTGLLSWSGFGDNTYIRFNEFNIEKVKSILKEYKNYKFKKFKRTEEYVDYLSNIKLPWEVSGEIKERIIKSKAKSLNVKIDLEKNIDEQIKDLDNIQSKITFDASVDKISLDEVKEELNILSYRINKNSNYEEIPRDMRLEWFIAIFTAKIYGKQYVKPNLKFDDEGVPKSFASAGTPDIEFITEKIHCLIEVTLMTNYQQQTNSETTSITDHLRNLKTSKQKSSLLIAPYIHSRVVDYFQYSYDKNKLLVIALSIKLYIDALEKNKTLELFEKFIEFMAIKLQDLDMQSYTDYVNNMNK